MIYVCSIYSLDAKGEGDSAKAKRQARYNYAMKRTAELLNNGNKAYSPIVHCHEMAKVHGLPHEYTFWQSMDRHMIDLSESVVVLCMRTSQGKGWQDSEGITDEVKYAISKGKPVVFLSANDYFDPLD